MGDESLNISSQPKHLLFVIQEVISGEVINFLVDNRLKEFTNNIKETDKAILKWRQMITSIIETEQTADKNPES